MSKEFEEESERLAVTNVNGYSGEYKGKKVIIEIAVNDHFDEQEVRRTVNATNAYHALYEIREVCYRSKNRPEEEEEGGKEQDFINVLDEIMEIIDERVNLNKDFT